MSKVHSNLIVCNSVYRKSLIYNSALKDDHSKKYTVWNSATQFEIPFCYCFGICINNFISINMRDSCLSCFGHSSGSRSILIRNTQGLAYYRDSINDYSKMIGWQMEVIQFLEVQLPTWNYLQKYGSDVYLLE